jgi:serine/threonine protein phosphatase PrpC
MLGNDGNGSDNMTVIIVDFLQHSGGHNGTKKSGVADKIGSKETGKTKQMGRK